MRLQNADTSNSNFPLLILYPAGPGFLFKTSQPVSSKVKRRTNAPSTQYKKYLMSYSIIQFLNNSMGPILQVLALGNYRHDIAYTAALKSTLAWVPVALAQGSYRYDIAYTAALKSIQTLAKGSYRQDIAYTGALKSAPHDLNLDPKTGATHTIVAPVFYFKTQQGVAA